ncbi:MAG: hypothetical protein HYW07_22800 [Candidatus Latescibacteria bacterium]|nr:hypothetical protein [Candidatus Latescibacterota bacterium]
MRDSSPLFEKNSATQGRLRLGPLSRTAAEGFGASLRRALMREVRGAAVSAVRIEGIAHEFTALDGVVEEVIQIVENLKKVRVGLKRIGTWRVAVSASGPRTVTAADLAREPGVRVADPAQLIATVAEGGRLEMSVEIASGTGYEGVQEWQDRRPGWIEIDRNYTPVRQVAIQVGEKGDRVFLELAITTDGTVPVEEALAQAAVALELQAGVREPVPTLCRAVVEAACRPVPAPVEPVLGPEPRTREFCKTPPAVPIPDLTGLPKRSFEAFAQRECRTAERKLQGLERLLREAFPIELAHGERLEYEGYAIDQADACSQDCVRFGRTYAGRLEIRLRSTGSGEVREVDAGRLPLVTERGTFVIAGREKAVVGQLQALEGEGPNDLANRRLWLVGDQLAAALAGPLAADVEAAKGAASAAEVALPGFAAALGRFFTGGGCVRQVEDLNPLALVSQVRAVVQSGIRLPGFEARDVHPSHFGRLCLLETPEGEKIGINLSAAILAQVDGEGRLLTPYRRQDGDEIEYLSPESEFEKRIADLGAGDGYAARYGGRVLGREKGEIVRIDAGDAQYVPAHPGQLLGASASLIPFVAHDDANRALMGTNMQKQAVPLLIAEAPLVRTGMETRVAGDAGACVRAAADGVVVRVAAAEVVIRQNGDDLERRYPVAGFSSSSGGTRWRQRPLVRTGDLVIAGQLIAEGPASEGGALALGRNLLVGYLPWEGYNFEDSLVISERLIRDEVFTSIKARQFTATIANADTQVEQFRSDHLAQAEKARLTPEGVAREGAVVEGGEVLIAKGALKEGEWHDLSLRLPAGQCGTVVKVERYAASQGDPLAEGVGELVHVTVAVRRRLKVGDKLANRHGAKGTVGRIVAEDEMPVLPDGRILDLILDPLGVPSRMNLGQLLETHLGLAAHALNCAVITPGFNGAVVADVDAMLAEAGLPRSGMLRLRDGRTGRLFDCESTAGYQYVMKLAHMVDDKRQARGAGAGAEGTGQPVGGRRNSEGQRLGIMELWALQAHGAGHILQEMLTLKADDVDSRRRTCEALLRGGALPRPTVPHSVRRLVAQLRGLCLELKIFGEDGREMPVFAGEVSIEDAATAALEFASAEKVRSWSVGRLEAEGAAAAFEEFFGAADGLDLKHVELAVPVKHPWRTLVGERAHELPEIAALPVLPRSLRGGSGLDRLYLELRAADSAVRRSGATAEKAAALQTAVDRLMGEQGLTQLLYGKRGWFAAAMSGKAVDYSGRSVVSPGCGLRYDECGLPRSMARVLFEPLVVGELLRAGHAASAEEAKQLLRAGAPRAVAALERAVAARWVLLHRAPVLHRWGIQAFRPVLTDEEVVRLHPLMLPAFNADFDGDELGVFLPLSPEAQEEAGCMRPSANQMALATWRYLNGPTQDMVLGWYYATVKHGGGRALRTFAALEAVAAAFEQGEVRVHDPIAVGRGKTARPTTVGRALFNQMLPGEWEWIEEPVDQKALSGFMLRCWHELGPEVAARLGDALMRSGFRLATLSGLSIGKEVLAPYSQCESRIADAWRKAEELEARGGESATALVEHWLRFTGELAEEALAELAADRDGLNPVHLMRVSGARSNRDQVKQLVAMRGLLATPDRRIIAAPCTTSFIRGHSQLEYLASTYGARKGLSDTSLRTAKAGFLFKRIANAVQDLLVLEEDCGTGEGVVKRGMRSRQGELVPLAQRLAGRTALEDVALPGADAPLVRRGALISGKATAAIAASGLEAVAVRSPLTCKTEGGICGKCYGADLSRWQMAVPGLAVGIIAAQSIGEPMTQLTMRTFSFGTPARLGGELGTIVGGLPRLDELFEAGRCPGQEESEERAALDELLRREGVPTAAEYLLREMAEIYRRQGVLVDDRHFEVVLRQMLGQVRVASGGDTGLETGAITSAAHLEAANAAAAGEPALGEPVVLGVTEVAVLAQDFLAAGIAYGGIPALAAAAAVKAKVALNGVRSCTLFGKVIPAKGGG